jgi:hypothetical protein
LFIGVESERNRCNEPIDGASGLEKIQDVAGRDNSMLQVEGRVKRSA